jgi:hypothetical protein
MGYVRKRKSSCSFYLSVWVDSVILCILYLGLAAYSILLLFPWYKIRTRIMRVC